MDIQLKDFKEEPLNESNHINVERGLDDFNKVAEELEQDYKESVAKDVESLSEEDFKLRNYFETSQRMSLENGGRPKKMGVVFKNLTVVGKGADLSTISDLSTPFRSLVELFKFKWIKRENTSSTFDILHKVTGYCKDGEMLLVLGRPGSGCSTLLRVLSNRRNSYIDVLGDVTYGGLSHKEWEKFKGESIYIPEEDCHSPTLTVRETLDFALKCKTPHNRLPDEKKRTFRTKIFDLLVNMFGITKQSDTVVGDEFLRGLSGGEKKRLTIAESMVASSSINCYDCSTRGLDAASALDYAKSIRIMSDTLHKTTIASFYQASDSIYNLFDKVLILEKGRCIYFGSTQDAKQYFLDMGFDCELRKSTPDFLTGITNPQERKVKKGFEGNVPITSEDFETAWLKSEQYQNSINEINEYEKKVEIDQPKNDFIQEVHQQKSKNVSKKSQYTTSFFTQIIALTIRNYKLVWGDKFGISFRYFSVIVQSLIYGSIFFRMTKDSMDGAFTRGGALFCSILFNAFFSEGELPVAYVGRRILEKHKSYSMYRPSALHLAQVLTDIPIIFIQVFVYSFIIYFMYGLEAVASKYFIFVFALIGLSLWTQNLYRWFGVLTPSIYIAQNGVNILIVSLFTYSGYLVPLSKMHPWFKWIYWVNPFAYCFNALMQNEFKGMNFDCSQMSIPYSTVNGSTTYSDAAYRACPTAAALPGEMSFSGESYIDYSLSVKASLSLNVIVVYLFWLLSVFLNCVAMEYIDWTGGNFTCKVYKKGKAPKLNDAEEEKKQILMVENATNNMKESLKMPGGLFTWQNINYTVPVSGGKKLLLDDVEGWIKPGQMTALMGSSGAGKTTLLDVLAKRKTIGEIKGKCFLNGKSLQIDFERITGYVEQMDVHNPGLTVRESLRFSAKLRQEPEIPLQEKYDYVEKVLEMMEMKHLGDALIGNLDTGIGISVEERKRLTIGVELVAKPHILFLDEPTSGLDAQSSYNIVKFIRKLADAGMPLVCTIHQPSSVLFEHFDRILLLAKGGKTVYFGDIGEKSKTLTSYFERHGVRPCNEIENPAEYILEATGAGVYGKTDVDWPAAWKNSPEYKAVEDELGALEAAGPIPGMDNGSPREFATSIWYQSWEVYKRLNLIWYRDPFYTFGTFVQIAITGLIIGFTFYNLKNSSTDMNQRIFYIFEALLIGVLMMFLVLPQFLSQRDYFRRDYASKFYSWLPFAIGISTVELPYAVISATIFYITSYFTAGLQHDGNTNFYFWFLYVVFIFFCISMGQAIGAVCQNIYLSYVISPLFLVFLFLLCGVMVPPSDIPTFWKWVYDLNPCTHFLIGIITNVLKNVDVRCAQDDFVKFIKDPVFATCEEYGYEFINVTKADGYVETLENGDCGYCTFKAGSEYYESRGWDYDHRWRSFGIVTGYWIFNSLLVVVFVYLTRKGSR
ncbi:hypothetical protein DICPUDRAFT_155216 [Dictyostelium purpureum]|uniref:ABC transporter domain-containing protein n=1 Tax=Dictyostelium purpureum TaxID=5786 RepID=F0ZTD6_DICPU|nr:uncharacterized protein DICPUDRAFT_155216 [Dictyostelium purpureum]EGC32790.1 hypothetical protein DICPUDRAFT_155216 [Dictyostelium purpureum]|eukprot:XP_003290678.1 hypothetical protein DICPUDRAFT_155216 [Dictyostelium purpureum]